MALVIILGIFAFFTWIIVASIPHGRKQFYQQWYATQWGSVPSPEPLSYAEAEEEQDAPAPKRKRPRKTVKFEDGPAQPVKHLYTNDKGEIVESYHDLTDLPGWSMI
jgi:hypothetical protein